MFHDNAFIHFMTFRGCFFIRGIKKSLPPAVCNWFLSLDQKQFIYLFLQAALVSVYTNHTAKKKHIMLNLRS